MLVTGAAARTHCLVRWVSREYFPSLYVLKHSDSGGIWNPEIDLKTCLLNLWKVTCFSEAWACYEFNNWHNQCAAPHCPISQALPFPISEPRFEARKARSMKHNLVQLSSSEIHACSCPNGAVILSSNLISLPVPLLSANRWHISTNRACLCCQYLQRSRKLSQTLQSQRCYPKKATTNTWQENEMMRNLPKIIKKELHICPFDIIQYCGDSKCPRRWCISS